jgi:hypothetical protein
MEREVDPDKYTSAYTNHRLACSRTVILSSQQANLMNGQSLKNIKPKSTFATTYDHRSVRTGHPVRSAIHKH